MSDAVTYRRQGEVGILQLNRPDNRNSMTPDLLDAFVTASGAARSDKDIRALVIAGSGSCFSAGADFKSIVQRGDDRALPHERSYAMYEPFLTVLDIEVPIIGALGGHAVGGGFGLSLLCDVRVGNRAAKYGANFCRLGLAPGMGISFTLPRLVGIARASELLYSGRLFDGDEGLAMGYLWQAVPAEDVLDRAMAVAQDIAQGAPLAVRQTVRLVRGDFAGEVRRAARQEAYAQAATLATDDFREGVAALLDKRAPHFRGQ